MVSLDMFSFQQAFLRESVEADTQNARAIKYTRGFLSGEQTTNNARVQLWKPLEAEDFGDTVSCRNSLTGASVGLGSTKRSVAPSEQIRVKPTRLVLYLDEMIYSIFITDDLVHTISNTSPRTLKIRPSSHRRGFNNPTSVKACVLGDPKRDISGGFRLDKEGLGIESQEAFDDFKWLEIVFQTEAECAYFVEDISVALQERRKERRVVEVLRKKAGRGVKAGEGLT